MKLILIILGFLWRQNQTIIYLLYCKLKKGRIIKSGEKFFQNPNWILPELSQLSKTRFVNRKKFKLNIIKQKQLKKKFSKQIIIKKNLKKMPLRRLEFANKRR